MLTNSQFLLFPDVPFGYISVSSSTECARHTPSSEADLSSKIHRKVVTRRLGVYPFPHQSSAPGILLRRKLIYSRKTVARLCVLFGYIPISSSVECARHTPSSEADLFSKIHRKVVTRRLGGSRPSAQNRSFAALRDFPSLRGLGLFFQ